MLDAFIIEQLERERRQREWEPERLELPLAPLQAPDVNRGDGEAATEEPERGVEIIPIFG